MNILEVIAEHLNILKAVLAELEVLLGDNSTKDKLAATIDTLETAVNGTSVEPEGTTRASV